MNGSAPNEFSTGFQSEPNKKGSTPNLWNAGAESRAQITTITPTTRRTAPPKSVSVTAKTWSPAWLVLLLFRNHLLPLNGDRLDLRIDAGLHRLGQRRVIERAGHLLTVVRRPPEELDQRLAFGAVELVLVDE